MTSKQAFMAAAAAVSILSPAYAYAATPGDGAIEADAPHGAAGAAPIVSDTRPEAAGEAASAEGDPSADLGEVVVTARRREESAQRVPLSVTVFSAEQIRRANVQDFRALQAITPSLSMMGLFQDYLILGIRGQRSVNIYFDEALIPYNAGSGTGSTVGGPGLFYDLENIQVLKGPQGTLFGRNTTGGAILFQSKRPGNEFGGDLSLGYGSFNNREISGALNLPLVEDKLLARIAVNAQARDGYTQTMATPSHPDGLDLDDRNFWAVRGSLTFKPTDGFRNELIVSHYKSRNNGSSALLLALDPSGRAAKAYPQLVAQFEAQQKLGIRRQIPIDIDTFTRSRLTSLTNITSIDLSDDVTFRNIFNFTDAASDRTVDYDGNQFPIYNRFTAVIDPSKQKLYTFEPQLQGNSLGDRLTWVGGLYHSNNPTPFATFQTVSYGKAGAVSVKTRDKSTAVYAQATYDLSSVLDGLKVTAGGRYTWDRPHQETQAVDGNGTCTTSPCTVTVREATFRAPTWTLGLDYSFGRSSMVYLASRRGFKTGGFNNQAPTPALLNYGPEYVTDVELGLKSDFRAGDLPVRANAAIYHQDYSSIQGSQSVAGAPGQPTAYAITNNSAGARVWGAEFEGAIRPTENLSIGAYAAWLNFDYTSFEAGVDGAALRRTVLYTRPEFTYGINAHYEAPLAAGMGTISLSGRWDWQSETSRTMVGTPANLVPAAMAFQPSYGLLNFTLDWNDIGGSALGASIYVTNAANKVYTNGGQVLYSTQGFTTVNYGEPRMVGVRLRYSFGQ
ncbi:MAG: TonB-dependent receptor plug domain-containing protein [Phenylobacterium sp.]|nr:TonB-dependent receptor plug domain-containing protein [Phenylobacterium sp.]